jgi:hypothetical protein
MESGGEAMSAIGRNVPSSDGLDQAEAPGADASQNQAASGPTAAAAPPVPTQVALPDGLRSAVCAEDAQRFPGLQVMDFQVPQVTGTTRAPGGGFDVTLTTMKSLPIKGATDPLQGTARTYRVSTDGTVSLTSPPESDETIPWMTDGGKQLVADMFNSDNGGNWQIRPVNVDPLTGRIENAERTDPVGAPVTLTQDEATAKAKDFLTKNAALLGLSEDDVANLSIKATPFTPESTKLAWTVDVLGKLPMPGYEQFPDLARNVAMTLQVGKDGEIRYLGAGSSSILPQLHLSSTPGLAPDDPQVRENVLGTDLVYHPPRRFVGPPPQDVSLGKVTAADIKSTALGVHIRNDNGKTAEFTLAYDLEVRKGGHTFAFSVDAATGRVLEQRQQS